MQIYAILLMIAKFSVVIRFAEQLKQLFAKENRMDLKSCPV